MLDARTKELIAIGCSVACNCHPCVEHHISTAREMEIDQDDIRQAVETGRMVRGGAAGQMDKLLAELSE